jgi:hypothetical protein
MSFQSLIFIQVNTTLQAVRKLKDDHMDLASRAAELVVAVAAECAVSSSLSEEAETHIKSLTV